MYTLHLSADMGSSYQTAGVKLHTIEEFDYLCTEFDKNMVRWVIVDGQGVRVKTGAVIKAIVADVKSRPAGTMTATEDKFVTEDLAKLGINVLNFEDVVGLMKEHH